MFCSSVFPSDLIQVEPLHLSLCSKCATLLWLHGWFRPWPSCVTRFWWCIIDFISMKLGDWLQRWRTPWYGNTSSPDKSRKLQYTPKKGATSGPFLSEDLSIVKVVVKKWLYYFIMCLSTIFDLFMSICRFFYFVPRQPVPFLLV
jgi:hypothetical protein